VEKASSTSWRAGATAVFHSGRWLDAYAGLLLKLPAKRLTLVALGNTDGLNWPNPLQEAAIEANPLAAEFLELFAE